MTAIIDYGMGNLRSVEKACEFLGFSAEITADPQRILAADSVILPGVGAFGQAIAQLKKTGLDQTILQLHEQGRPLLGICLGMQLLFFYSLEGGRFDGLGIFPDGIVPFEKDVLVPQIGWNSITVYDDVLFCGVPSGSYVYFVHSFKAPQTDRPWTAATCCYGRDYTCAARDGNTFGTQFHPEKSGDVGLAILKNFLSLGGK